MLHVARVTSGPRGYQENGRTGSFTIFTELFIFMIAILYVALWPSYQYLVILSAHLVESIPFTR